jgi:hypothetical protein
MPELSQKLGARPGIEQLVFFTTSKAELERRFAGLKKTLAPADGLWIAWPKKSAAIDELWQALRFVYRRKDR